MPEIKKSLPKSTGELQVIRKRKYKYRKAIPGPTNKINKSDMYMG